MSQRLDSVVSARRSAALVRGAALFVVTLGLVMTPHSRGQQQPDAAAAPQMAASAPAYGTAAKPATPAKGNKGKAAYTGPTTVVVLPATPMLDDEGKQRLDPDGKPMFNPAVQQLRDKKGHPVFDSDGKPMFQTAGNLGYDEKGKKIVEKKVKTPKATPMSISAGTLTVDGWTGKARLNYDIADLKYLYIYAPGIGTTIVSRNTFPGATEQAGAFNDKTMKITVDGHSMEVASEKRLLEKKPESAWVAVDRSFLLPSKFPVFGYGTTTKSPYAWPGSKQMAEETGAVRPPPLPADVTPAPLLEPCPAGMMRPAGPPVLSGQKAAVQPCVPISAPPASSSATSPAATPSTTSAH